MDKRTRYLEHAALVRESHGLGYRPMSVGICQPLVIIILVGSSIGLAYIIIVFRSEAHDHVLSLLPSIIESGKASCNYATIHVNDRRETPALVLLQTSG